MWSDPQAEDSSDFLIFLSIDMSNLKKNFLLKYIVGLQYYIDFRCTI